MTIYVFIRSIFLSIESSQTLLMKCNFQVQLYKQLGCVWIKSNKLRKPSNFHALFSRFSYTLYKYICKYLRIYMRKPSVSKKTQELCY